MGRNAAAAAVRHHREAAVGRAARARRVRRGPCSCPRRTRASPRRHPARELDTTRTTLLTTPTAFSIGARDQALDLRGSGALVGRAHGHRRIGDVREQVGRQVLVKPPQPKTIAATAKMKTLTGRRVAKSISFQRSLLPVGGRFAFRRLIRSSICSSVIPIERIRTLTCSSCSSVMLAKSGRPIAAALGEPPGRSRRAARSRRS